MVYGKSYWNAWQMMSPGCTLCLCYHAWQWVAIQEELFQWLQHGR